MEKQFKFSVGSVEVCLQHGTVFAETEEQALAAVRDDLMFGDVRKVMEADDSVRIHISEAAACACERH